MKNYITKSENETKNFAKEFAKSLKKDSIIVLNRWASALGKTKFTEGILEYFGLADEISSPTFTIVNEYKAAEISIYHFDVYRLKNEEDFYDIGGEEYFGNRNLHNRMGRNYKKHTSRKYYIYQFWKR